jgi:hypothetical protein
VDGSLSDIQLFKIVNNNLGNTIYKTKSACVLYVFSRYLNVFNEIREINGIFTFIVQEHVNIEFVMTVCVVSGTVLTQLNDLFLEFVRLLVQLAVTLDQLYNDVFER